VRDRALKAKLAVVFILVAAVVGLKIVLLRPPAPTPAPESRQTDVSSQPEAEPPPQPSATAPAPIIGPPEALPPVHAAKRPSPTASGTNRLDRLTQIREEFRRLAVGDPGVALRAAKEITDGTERETALLTLVTEWTHGNLRSPEERARAIADYGLEAGLGMELARYPELAQSWADELTDAAGRVAVMAAAGSAMVSTNAAAAFALGDQIPENNRRKFLDAIFAGWASQDTEAALRWVDQVADPAERDADLAAIRASAPVGIGTQLSMQDGVPVINQLLPGAAAELSGQLHQGDRIVAVAEGYGSFVETRGMTLQDIVQMLRGAAGTFLQLQVLSADSPADSLRRTVPITRSQIKFKQPSN
jgi:hypothetical protein